MSISGISASPAVPRQPQPGGSATSAPQQTQKSQAPVGYAAQQAARARYLRTGIDKDASLGDPDHDAGRAAQVAAQPKPAETSSASGTAAGSGSVNVIA